MAIDLCSGALSAGTYRNAAFHPMITLIVGEGWSATVLDGFFDVQRHRADRLLAVMVGGPTDGWPDAFALAEPVLASLRFDP